MKKFAPFTIVLCVLLLMECLCSPVAALSNLQTVPPQTVPSATEPSTASTYAFGTVCIYQGCRTIDSGVALGTSERILETAQAAVLFEAKTNTMIYSYNPDVKLSPGSLAKVVTALVVIENCDDLDEMVTVSSRNISRLPGGILHVYLKDSEQISVRDLLYCMLLQGANDAAIALAEHVSGNMQGFVVLMNDRVKRMGCLNTEFANVHGLDNAAQHTTARDMARIMMEAYKNKTFVEISSAVSHTVPETNRSKKRDFRTINYLIDEYIVPQFYDTRVKTGFAAYAEASGAGLVCVAETETKDPSRNMQLVGVILGANRIIEPGGWRVQSYGNFNEMIDLLEYGFNNFKVNRIIFDGQALNQFSVIGGECEAVGQPHVDIDTVLPADCHMKNLEMRYSVTGGSLTAPVKAEDMISTVQVWYRNSCVAEAELYAMSDVHKTEDLDVTIHSHIRKNEESGGVGATIGKICMGIIVLIVIYLVVNTIHRKRMQAKRRRRRANRRRSY